MPRCRLPRLLVLGLLCASAAAQAGLRYRVLDLGLPPGLDDTWNISPTDLNNRGEVVGYLQARSAGDPVGFVYRDGRMQALRSGRQAALFAEGINDRGRIVGTLATADGRQVPFLHAGGRFRDLGSGLDGPHYGHAYDINAAGQAVGQYGFGTLYHDGTRSRDLDVPGITHEELWRINDRGAVAGQGRLEGSFDDQLRTFIWEAGRTRVLPLTSPGAYGVRVSDLNDAGQVALMAFASSGTVTSWVWDGDRYRTVRGLPDKPSTLLFALNDRGWGAGQSDGYVPGRPVTRTAAVLWRDGRTVDLNALLEGADAQRWWLTGATAINERGQVAGFGYLDGGADARAFLATPVPEPAAWMAGLAGLALTAGAAARRRRAGPAA